MTVKDKISYVIELIDNARQIAPKGHVCWINHETIDASKVTTVELHSILKKLQIDEGIIELLGSPLTHEVGSWSLDSIQPKMFELKILPEFEAYNLA